MGLFKRRKKRQYLELTNHMSIVIGLAPLLLSFIFGILKLHIVKS